MADFCPECWNRMNNTDESPDKFFLTDEPELCEGCGEQKRVIIAMRKGYYAYKFRYLILPFKIVCLVIYCASGIIILPYLIYKYNKKK